MRVTIEISPGELLDRITILEIKSELIPDASKLAHIRFELAAMTAALSRAFGGSDSIEEYKMRLKTVNLAVWHMIEEMETSRSSGVPVCEKTFSDAYLLNRERVKIKQDVDVFLKSAIVEEKSYLPPSGNNT